MKIVSNVSDEKPFVNMIVEYGEDGSKRKIKKEMKNIKIKKFFNSKILRKNSFKTLPVF